MFQNGLLDFRDFHQCMEFITWSLADPSSYHHKGAKHTPVFVKGQRLAEARE